MDRSRISITLKSSLLNKVDQQIDGMKIRNRSHAIEYFLSQSLSPGITHAAILAGGNDFILDKKAISKSLVPIKNRPLLEHTFDLLRTYHLTDVTIASGKSTDQIRTRFGNGNQLGMQLRYSDQTTSTGTGGALKALSPIMQDQPFVLLHGDILIDIDLQDLIQFHLESENLITLALTSVSDPRAYGSVQVKRNQVVSFDEKPHDGEKASNLINAGVYIISPEFLQEIPSTPHSSIEKDVLPTLARQGKVGAYIFDGRWLNISNPDSYQQALKNW